MDINSFNQKVDHALRQLQKEALKKRSLVNNTNQKIIDDLLNKTLNGINEVVQKVNSTIDLQEAENLDLIYDKCLATIEHNQKRIIELKERNTDKGLKDFLNSEEVQNAYSAVKDVGVKVYDDLKNYMNKPETQEKIDDVKKKTIDYAQKGLDKLRDILKVEK